MPDFTAYVKAHTIKDGDKQGHQGQLGACPFSHRVLLLLEEKNCTYELQFINVDKKPEWLLEVNPNGTVPVVKDNETEGFIVDSDTFSDYLEEKYAVGEDIEKPLLGKLIDCPQPGAKLWPSFMEYLTGGGDKSKMEEELDQIEATVNNSNPYVGGHNPNAYDVALAPRLYLARMACKALKDWDFADGRTNLKAYIMRWLGRPSWRNTASWDEESIVEEFKAKMSKPEK